VAFATFSYKSIAAAIATIIIGKFSTVAKEAVASIAKACKAIPVFAAINNTVAFTAAVKWSVSTAFPAFVHEVVKTVSAFPAIISEAITLFSVSGMAAFSAIFHKIRKTVPAIPAIIGEAIAFVTVSVALVAIVRKAISAFVTAIGKAIANATSVRSVAAAFFTAILAQRVELWHERKRSAKYGKENQAND
jgi:hypothetical protein